MKTLLISDVPPTKRFSGALLTWHLCKNFTASSLAGYYPIAHVLSDVKPEYPFEGKVESKIVIKRIERSFRPRLVPYKIRFVPSFLSELYRKNIEAPRLAKDALRFAENTGADRIWVILQGQTLIWIAEYLIKHSSLPVHVQVWDSPAWWIKANQIDRFSARLLQKSYQFCLNKSAEFASPSFFMADKYFKTHNRKSETLLGITPSEFVVREEKEKDRNKIIIGLAGQIYATDAFTSLIEALDSVYWEIDGRKVEIHYWGYSAMPPRTNRTRIIHKGYVAQDQLTQELSKCDILYCPYWFARDFREEVMTSFPSKVTSYLASNSVLFFHGPEYSSPVKLLQEGPSAILCFSCDQESIKLKLREALYSPKRNQILENAKKIVSGPLSEGFLHKGFKRFMRLPQEHL